MKIKSICVFCGSSMGRNDIYKEKAKDLGEFLASRNITLVYGGGGVGLMGVLAESVIKNGGHVTGVIPELIFSKVNHLPDVEVIITADMHERKSKMYEMSDAFTALPGGLGTIEEIAEVYTWQQLGYHSKAVSLFNIDGFYDHFLDFILHSENEGFIKKIHRERLIIEESPEKLLERIEGYEGKTVDKWG